MRRRVGHALNVKQLLDVRDLQNSRASPPPYVDQLVGSPGWTNGSAATLSPRPDYFTTILAKQVRGATGVAPSGFTRRVHLPFIFAQILGRGVLGTSANGPAALMDSFDVHAWCARGYAPGAVSVAWTNLGGSDVALSLGAGFDGQTRIEYTLTSSADGYAQAEPSRVAHAAPPPSVQGDAIFLNGVLMTVDSETGLLPAYPIPGKSVPGGSGSLLAPAYAYGFVVFPSAAALACEQ